MIINLLGITTKSTFQTIKHDGDGDGDGSEVMVMMVMMKVE